MALIMCGHQRSGTTMLRTLCNSHPEIVLSDEFGNFFGLNLPLPDYRRQMLRRWWNARNRPFFPARASGYDRVSAAHENSKVAYWAHKYSRVHLLQNFTFVTRFLRRLPTPAGELVNVAAIETSLQRVFAGARIVGDKHPDYVFNLKRLASAPGLQCVVIYRDPRDVTSSTLEMARKISLRYWGDDVRSPEKIARRWVAGIEAMEREKDRTYIIRYEDLIAYPEPVLQGLARWLGIDPDGFPKQLIRRGSVGKHRSGLSPAELESVLSVAGPTMKRLGYQVQPDD
jgi:Sulfotransferase family